MPEQELRRLNRSLQALRHSAQALIHASDEAEYLRDICRIVAEDCGHRMVWIGFAEQDAGRTVRPVAYSGFEHGYLETLKITWADSPRGRGPTGTAIRTGQPRICRNILTDPDLEPWREQAILRGYAASIALPLLASPGGRAFGALMIYCTEPDPFSDDEVRLLQDLANDLANGIHVLRLRAAHARSEAALRDADRRKDEFLATLSHELRTPLNAIVGWSQMLLAGGLDDAARRRAIEAIARNALVQSQIVNDVLDVSRIVQGKIVLDVREVDVADVMQQAIESVRHAFESKRIRLHVAGGAPLVASGDPARLQQVFWNLLSNAVKFTPDEGDVRIVMDHDAGHLRVRVEDTGIGIPPDFLPRVFDRFSQADSSLSRTHPGLGLGLAIVRHLVEMHGGTITAESEGQGRGAAFTIRLPVRAVCQGLACAPDPVRAPGPIQAFDGVADTPALTGVRALVVDDERDARELVRTVLELRGASVATAASARAAIDRLRGASFDVLVADIGMPGEDGYALIGRLRQFSSIPAIALTAYGRDTDRRRALEAGYQDHLTKPVLPDALVKAVASVLGEPAV